MTWASAVLGAPHPVYDPHGVAVRHHAHDGADERRRVLLAVPPPRHDGVEQLAPRAQLHGDAHVVLVLVHALHSMPTGEHVRTGMLVWVQRLGVGVWTRLRYLVLLSCTLVCR